MRPADPRGSAALDRAIAAEKVATEALCASHDEGFGDCPHFEDADVAQAQGPCEFCDASAVVHALMVADFIPREVGRAYPRPKATPGYGPIR